MRVFFFILLISFSACSESQKDRVSVNEQEFEIATMSKHGMTANFYFHCFIPNEYASDNSKVDRLQQSISEQLDKIADESTMLELVNSVDSIGVLIYNEIKGEFDLEDLKIQEIGVEEQVKEYLVKMKANVDLIKVVTYDEIKNFSNREELSSPEKSRSTELSLVLKTKYDSEVLIEYVIYFSTENNFGNPVDSLDEHIKKAITDSLHQYDMYEMWATKRGSLHLIMEDIIKKSYPDTYQVEVRDLVIPEEAKKQFLETDKARQVVLDSLFKIDDAKKLLTQEIETNKDLTKDEIISIEKEIQLLENNWKTIQKKGKLLTRDYKL